MVDLKLLSEKLGRSGTKDRYDASYSYLNDESSGEDSASASASTPLSTEQPHRRQQRSRVSAFCASEYGLALQLVLFCAGFAFFVTGLVARRRMTDRQCAAQLSSYSPGVDYVEYEMVQFDPFGTDSPYKGAPSPELDAAWEELVNLGTVKLTRDDMRALHKPLSQVKITEEDGEDLYMAGVEVFHQLHCLQYIRQYTYFDYYANLEKPPNAFRDPEPAMRDHLDHCIDRIRQAIQCSGDVGVYTHSWVETRGLPYPDFAAWHKCRKLEPLNDYVAQNGFPRWPNKTDAEIVLKEPPCMNTPRGVDCP